MKRKLSLNYCPIALPTQEYCYPFGCFSHISESPIVIANSGVPDSGPLCASLRGAARDSGDARPQDGEREVRGRRHDDDSGGVHSGQRTRQSGRDEPLSRDELLADVRYSLREQERRARVRAPEQLGHQHAHDRHHRYGARRRSGHVLYTLQTTEYFCRVILRNLYRVHFVNSSYRLLSHL